MTVHSTKQSLACVGVHGGTKQSLACNQKQQTVKNNNKKTSVVLKQKEKKYVDFNKINNDYDEKYNEEEIEYFNNKKKSKIISKFPSIKFLRSETLKKINKFIQNKKISSQIERGIIKYTNKICTKNICYEAIYKSKSQDIIANIDPKSQINNKNFVKRILNKTLMYNGNTLEDYENVAFMKPQEIFPEKWEIILKKKIIREDKLTNISTTDAYQCPNCKKRKCRASAPKQIRSADEPMTAWVTCAMEDCGHTWRIMC